MKKIKIAVRNDENNLEEKTVFYKKLKDAMNEEGYVATISSERVKHPSPAILENVISNHTNVTLEVFYKWCETIAEELKNQDT